MDLTPADKKILSGAAWVEHVGDKGELIRMVMVCAYRGEMVRLVRHKLVEHRHGLFWQLTDKGRIAARDQGAKL